MTQSVSRDWNFDALTRAGVAVPSETLKLGSGIGFIHSVTIDNGTNCDCGVYIARDPAGQPTFIVAAGTYKTQPVTAQLVGIKFSPPSGDQPRGQAYAHLTDETLSASSGQSALATGATGVWDSSQWDTGAKMG